jgi:hypothetical protein
MVHVTECGEIVYADRRKLLPKFGFTSALDIHDSDAFFELLGSGSRRSGTWKGKQLRCRAIRVWLKKMMLNAESCVLMVLLPPWLADLEVASVNPGVNFHFLSLCPLNI